MAGPRYSIIPADALADDRITDLHLRVLAILGSHSDANGWLQINQKTLATRAKKTRETINRAIRDLVAFGYVRKRGRTGDDGRRLINKYQVVNDRAPLDDEVSEAPTYVIPTSQGVCDPHVTGYVTSRDHRVCDLQTSQQENDLFLERPLSPNGDARASCPCTDLVPMGNKVPTAHAPAAAFETWWSEYPEKVGKGAARKAFDQAQRKASLEVLIAGVKRYIATKPADRAWCHPSTWLNGERWLDQPAAKASQGLGEWALDRLRQMGGEHVDHQH